MAKLALHMTKTETCHAVTTMPHIQICKKIKPMTTFFTKLTVSQISCIQLFYQQTYQHMCNIFVLPLHPRVMKSADN